MSYYTCKTRVTVFSVSCPGETWCMPHLSRVTVFIVLCHSQRVGSTVHSTDRDPRIQRHEDSLIVSTSLVNGDKSGNDGLG